MLFRSPAGSIFSVLRCPEGVPGESERAFLQPGSRQVCAGYAIYGPTTMLVLTFGRGVHGFTLDREIGEFRQTRERQLQEQFMRMRGDIVQDIMKIVDSKVKADGYDLVLSQGGAKLKANFDDPSSPTVATEFIGTSVSSNPVTTNEVVAPFLSNNPHVKYFESRKRGYVMAEITRDQLTARFRAISDVTDPNATVDTLKTFIVESGKPGPVEA